MVFLVISVIAAFYDLNINLMDVKTTFLYDFIDQLINVKESKSTNTKRMHNFKCPF